MKYSDARRGAVVRTPDGTVGTIVSKSNGTVYVEIADGSFRRLLVGAVELLPQHAAATR